MIKIIKFQNKKSRKLLFSEFIKVADLYKLQNWSCQQLNLIFQNLQLCNFFWMGLQLFFWKQRNWCATFLQLFCLFKNRHLVKEQLFCNFFATVQNRFATLQLPPIGGSCKVSCR